MAYSQPVTPEYAVIIPCRDSDLVMSHNSSNMGSSDTVEITNLDLILKTVKGELSTFEGTLILSMLIQRFSGGKL